MSARFASCWTEDVAKTHTLRPPAPTKVAAGHIDCRADRPCKSEQVWTSEGQFDSSKATHRNTHHGSTLTTGQNRKAGLDVGKHIVNEVVFVPVFGI
jgi:hypothetical protein